ncbi:MAG: hypothetical protein ACREB8_05545 [Pseudolabrys sp.]
MNRLAAACAVAALLLPMAAGSAAPAADTRALPMQFEIWTEGSAQACGGKCGSFVSAAGAITSDTPRDFETFAKRHKLDGLTVGLDSDGGSVLGALSLGRAIRRLGMTTTVGRVSVLDQAKRRARLVSQAYCESMCAFVLLAGVERRVPADARVMVHQIWLGDRRDDPTAANYSAEDLVLVQRDIGRLAQYTVDMGGSIELLDLALRIPPWEPMHALTAQETRRTHLATEESAAPAVAATVAASPAAAATRLIPRITDGARATEISERRWSVVDRAGVASLARRQPLTVEGEDIGSFDLMLACGAGGDSYDVSYVEHRHGGGHVQVPAGVGAVTMTVGRHSAALKVMSSKRSTRPDELITYATGPVPAALVGAFAAIGSHSMLVETKSAGVATGIRLGNTGAQRSLPRLAAACAKAIGDRAELGGKKTGGMAVAK